MSEQPRRPSPPPRIRLDAACHKPPILIVGDGQEVETLAAAGRRAGLDLRLEAAPDVDAAWERLSRRRGRHESPPALLVVCHPERSGFLPFLRRLRADARLRRLPAVLLTPGAEPCPITDAADVFPVLYFPRPEGAEGRAPLLKVLASLLPGF